MNDELLASIEREVLSWPGVSKETHRGSQGRFWVPPATVYRFGRRQIGHIHNTGVADLAFPREIHDQLISDGRAKPHGAGFAGVVSYRIREPEDVPGAVELFRMSYERAKESAERRKETTEHRYSNDKQDWQDSGRDFERSAG
jgi:luciferase-like monooxygenase